MATVSLSPTAFSTTAMNVKRAPLANNPNVANSPLRGHSVLAGYAKSKRSHATLQREEPYGQPPPIKKQALENGAQRAVRSPSKPASRQAQVNVQRGNTTTRSLLRDRASASRGASATRTGQDADTEKEAWKKHHRAKFPKMVFYFESIPEDTRAWLTRRISYLGARQEPFFSIEVTHVITTRTIPPEKPEADSAQVAEVELGQRKTEDMPQTINPSLLNRNSAVSAATAGRRRLIFDFQRTQSQSSQVDDLTKRSKPLRNNDVLHKARELGKKIWSLDKFHTMLSVLLESDTHSGVSTAATVRNHHGPSRNGHEPNLFQLLHNERINGPSDRDPTALARELTFFKGPYIYIFDIDERQKPMMVREYAKVANKTDGEWPQFRSVGNGRCPFVEEVEIPEQDFRKDRERQKARAAAKRAESVQKANAAEAPSRSEVTTEKRASTGLETAHPRTREVTPATDVLNPVTNSVTNSVKAVLSKPIDMKTQNAFTSRAAAGRVFAGEPVASGIQRSNITSAIRSQMISSTSGINGAKAGTSKEVHGLQRKVLQKASTTPHSVAEASLDAASSRSIALARTTSKTVPCADDDSQKTVESREKKPQSQSLRSKKDLKPGYCENCQDKFRDFDEHILSRKHRKFAENDDNWTDLDALLAMLSSSDELAETW